MKKTAMITVLLLCAVLSVFAGKKETESYASLRFDVPMTSSKTVTSLTTTKTKLTSVGFSLQGANFLAEVADDLQAGVAYGIQFASFPVAGKSVTKNELTDPIVVKFESDDLPDGQFFGALNLNVGGAFKYAIDKGLDALANVTLGMGFDSEKISESSKISTSRVSFGFEGGAAYEVADDISVTAGLGMQFGLSAKVTTKVGELKTTEDGVKTNTFYFFVGGCYAY